MVNSILIPTDGSDYGTTAIAYGILLARKLGARLTGLHVVDVRLMQGPAFTDLSGSIGIPPYQELLPAIQSGLEVKAEAILAEFRKQCEAAGIQPETKKIVGVIDEAIVEESQRCCDWVLLAQRGEHFHLGSGAILGSTAQSVVRRSGKPVLVTPEKFREIKTMALAYDGSPPADKALNLAADLAQAAGWPLSIVIVADDEALGAKQSQKARDILGPRNIASTAIVRKGKEDRELLRFIGEGSTDLLVMGAYGHNRLRELFLGSTTSAVIRKSTIPVLLTR